jgi:hypothetical protein
MLSKEREEAWKLMAECNAAQETFTAQSTARPQID